MSRHMTLVPGKNKRFHLFYVKLKSGKSPDQHKNLKEAIRKVLLFCETTYSEGLEQLDLAYGGHTVSEKELVNRVSKREWKMIFRKDSKGRQIAFRGLLGECLAYWVARDLKKYPVVSLVRPNGTDPAFDLVALEPSGGSYAIRWIQAKATKANYMANASLAVRKFGKMEKGEYSAEVSNTLYMLSLLARDQNVKVDSEALRKLQLVADNRRYTVFVVHDGIIVGDPMTQYPKHVPGSKDRREAIFMGFADLDAFLKEMEAAINANIS